MPIRSIADIPFRERDPFALLNLTPGMRGAPGLDPGNGPDNGLDDELGDDLGDEGPDLDYAGFGYARVGEIWLATHGDPEPRPVRHALLLALHTPDDAEAHDGDLLLEFWPEGAEGEDGTNDEPVVQVMLSRFLDVWLPRISSDERAIVLAVCNPHRTLLSRPPALRSVPIHYPLGDTTSWCEEPADFLAGGGALRLLADAWRTL
jgi:hypothetical protein